MLQARPGTTLLAAGRLPPDAVSSGAGHESEKFRVVAIVDDSPSLRDVYISGLRVQSPGIPEHLAHSRRIARVVFAMPSVPKSRQREIVAELEALPCEVHSVPGYAGLVEGELLSSVTSVSSDDLLGRNSRRPRHSGRREGLCRALGDDRRRRRRRLDRLGA